MPEDNRLRILCYIAIAVFIICIPLFLTSSHLTWSARDLQLYEYGFDQYNVSQDTGFSQEELSTIATGIIQYFNTGDVNDALNIFDEREMAHLSDVRGLIHLNYLIQQVTSGYMIVFIALGFFWKRRGFTNWLTQMVLTGSILTLFALISLGIAAVVDFDRLFTGFHELFFSGDSWILSGYLPRLFTQGLFSDTALFITGAMIAESLLLGGICGYLVLRQQRIRVNDRRWSS